VGLASEQKLASASFKAIGALSRVKLGWLNWQTKQYEPSVFLEEQVELLSLIGDVAVKDGEPQVHAHVVVANATVQRMVATCCKLTFVRLASWC